MDYVRFKTRKWIILVYSKNRGKYIQWQTCAKSDQIEEFWG